MISAKEARRYVEITNEIPSNGSDIEDMILDAVISGIIPS